MSIVDFTYKRLKIDRNDHQQIVKEMMPEIIYQSSFVPHNTVLKSNFGGWQGDLIDYDEKHPSHPVKPIYQKTFDEFSKLIANTPPREYLNLNLCFQYWVNVNFKGDFNMPHRHTPRNSDDAYCVLSGTYYLKKPKQSGNIVFTSDRQYYKKWFVGNFDHFVDLGEGELILFPPHLEHYVEPNRSNDMRVSIAFNLMIEQ